MSLQVEQYEPLKQQQQQQQHALRQGMPKPVKQSSFRKGKPSRRLSVSFSGANEALVIPRTEIDLLPDLFYSQQEILEFRCNFHMSQLRKQARRASMDSAFLPSTRPTLMAPQQQQQHHHQKQTTRAAYQRPRGGNGGKDVARAA
eukprot:CAMPEP_0118693614 /NCGR_PEP_ID=MMETSP0800-20121206/12014_1 /TAXON_ID=210618 ORGANISM="Striatella unipunctata, Strain CCMP2910" /NCGR_SAMPLE_ID=MMETSP0800 /ASSEMBLY_ACC=CAM_ASM_000638 /LENGTH=144 /DNA_ID=CAMNT_0006591885 /DNA_START=38 /DNA_END=472 /DNA_ORIENTATION=+